jgi:hypothetical protein
MRAAESFIVKGVCQQKGSNEGRLGDIWRVEEGKRRRRKPLRFEISSTSMALARTRGTCPNEKSLEKIKGDTATGEFLSETSQLKFTKFPGRQAPVKLTWVKSGLYTENTLLYL